MERVSSPLPKPSQVRRFPAKPLSKDSQVLKNWNLNNMLLPILVSAEMLRGRLQDSANRELAETIVTSADRRADMVYRVLAFARGSEANWTRISPLAVVKEIATTIESAVIIDMMMPMMSGVATTEALLRLNPEVKIIIVTGFVTDAQKKSAMTSGARELLAKPFTIEKLLATLARVLPSPAVGASTR
jgi:CheY-like chemotaxis protein